MNVGRNSLYNLAGSIVPLILALVTVPLYIKLVGVERYGALAIAWLILGYFGFFDMGLGRATAQRIATLTDASDQERSNVFWTAMVVNLGMGVAGGLLLYAAGHYFFANYFEVSDALRAELIGSLPILAAAVPVATATGVASGALQGREMFLQVNMNTVAGTTLFQLFPLAVAWQVGPTLATLIMAAVVARIIGFLLFALSVKRRVLKDAKMLFDKAQAKALFSFGGWVTITSIVSPLLVVVDRFVIGATISAVAVAIFTISFEIVQRVSLLPRSISMALFPRMAAMDKEASHKLLERMMRIMTLVVTPPVLFGIFAMRPFLELWVGEDLARQSAPIGMVLFVGYWINGYAIIPYARLQALGRPDLVTKALVAQLPFYLVAMYLALQSFGLIGAAIVFSIRTFVDYFILIYLSQGAFLFTREMVIAAVILAMAMVTVFTVAAFSPIWWAMLVTLGAALIFLLSRNMPVELKKIADRFVPSSLHKMLVFK